VTLTSAALRALLSSLFCSWHIHAVTKQLRLKQSIRRTLRIYTIRNTQACPYHLSNDLRPSWGLLCLSRWPYHLYELMQCDNSLVELEKWVTTMKVKPFYELWLFRTPPALWTPECRSQQCQNNGVKFTTHFRPLWRGQKQPVWLIALMIVTHFVKLSFLQSEKLQARTWRFVLNHFQVNLYVCLQDRISCCTTKVLDLRFDSMMLQCYREQKGLFFKLTHILTEPSSSGFVQWCAKGHSSFNI